MKRKNPFIAKFYILISGCIVLGLAVAILVTYVFQNKLIFEGDGKKTDPFGFLIETNLYTKSPSENSHPIHKRSKSPQSNGARQRILSELQNLPKGEHLDSPNALFLNVLRADHGAYVLKDIMEDTSVPLDHRKRIATALINSNSSDGINCVLVSAIHLHRTGRPGDAQELLSNLENPLSIDESNAMIDILIGNDSSGVAFDSIPDEIKSLIRKSLCSSSDGAEVGKVLAKVYLDLVDSGQSAKANELFYGVSHPEMLTELVTLAHGKGDSTQESILFERLIQTDKLGVVSALSRLAAKQPTLLAQSSEAMFNWSFDRRERAQPGLFTEYLNDNTLAVEERVVAAYGLAGMIGKADAMLALSKAASLESDQHTKDCLNSAIASLQNGLADERKSGDHPKSSQ